MVLVMATSHFPASKSEEVGNKFLEMLKKYPPDTTLGRVVLRAAVRITDDGWKSIQISEIKEGKFKEFMTNAYERVLEWTKIEGYRTELEVFMSGTEALPLIGLKMPEV
ncbi:MAG: hypothetical protein ACXADU_09765 [Promethearchaeota archaeon]